jgi:hypothetical protein
MPLNKNKDGDIDTTEKRTNFQKILEKELENVIIEIINTPGIIRKKGGLSMDRILKEHSSKEYVKKLETIYNENFDWQ